MKGFSVNTFSPFAWLLALAAAGLLACGPAATGTPPPTPTPQATEVPLLEDFPAPIESVAIEAATGDPTGAELVVVSGLPNACYSFKEHRISREGDRFQVAITNVRQGGAMVACAEIYGLVTTRIPMPGEVEVCRTYQVSVNDQDYSVQAIAPNARCADSFGTAGDELKLRMGETLPVGDAGLSLTFLEVSQDSRCPSDAVCVRAGDATVLLETSRNSQALEQFSLMLGPEVMDRSFRTVSGYTIVLTRLDPYPVSATHTSAEAYVATLKVAAEQ